MYFQSILKACSPDSHTFSGFVFVLFCFVFSRSFYATYLWTVHHFPAVYAQSLLKKKKEKKKEKKRNGDNDICK